VVSYYFLSVAVALTIFFIVWAILLETGDQVSFIPAGIISGLFMIAAFVLREVLLRRSRNASLRAEERLASKMASIVSRADQQNSKLTLRRNERLLGQILEKSKAARVLKHLPEAHWETFELCDSYLMLTRKELARTHINSPRIGPITKSRGRVKKLHKSHLHKWAKLRASMLMLKSKELGLEIEERAECAKMALIAIETALDFYPRDVSLIDSTEVIRDYLLSIRITGAVESAELAVKNGHHKRAIEIYYRALEQVEKSELRISEKNMISAKIKSEILKLQGR
jgi:hypothetical protein